MKSFQDADREKQTEVDGNGQIHPAYRVHSLQVLDTAGEKIALYCAEHGLDQDTLDGRWREGVDSIQEFIDVSVLRFCNHRYRPSCILQDQLMIHLLNSDICFPILQGCGSSEQANPSIVFM